MEVEKKFKKHMTYIIPAKIELGWKRNIVRNIGLNHSDRWKNLKINQDCILHKTGFQPICNF